jgi:serine protease Do
MHKASAEEGEGLPDGMEADPFFKFFRGMPGFPQRGRQNPSTPFKGLGSGFIISSDGLVLTNAHVVREAKDVTVKLSDRREFTAKVLGLDTATDIAVLRIDAWTCRWFARRPKDLEVGDPVLAIGALRPEQTATQGIVSAKGRSLRRRGRASSRRTRRSTRNSAARCSTAAARWSASTPRSTAQRASKASSFAILIDVALKVMEQIVATGKARHGRLGVTVQDLNQSLADSFGLKRAGGAGPNVAPGSAGRRRACRATSPRSTASRCCARQPVEPDRHGGARERVKPVWRRADDRRAARRRRGGRREGIADAGQAAAGQLGLSLRPLTREEKREAKLDAGLVVEDVGGAAARAGIQAGDVLLAINGKTVQSIEQVRGVIAAKPKSVALLVQRDGEKIFVPVKVG